MGQTIAAIASALGPAAIGVVRVSGGGALETVQKCLKNGRLEPGRMRHRALLGADGAAVDDVMVCYFKAPHSYTGEDCVEIYAHGGAVNLTRVLDTVLNAGARLAEPGEFSRRAFVNGKIDLARAEAIMDVIHAQNERQCREAQRQLSGTVSRAVEDLRGRVLELLCAVEASIDFSSEEELAPLPADRIRSVAQEVCGRIDGLVRAHERYRAGGVRAAFVGRPNAGKSSLFNALVGHDRAIVTNIAGTTTDTIEASVTIGGQLFCLTDTAGITQTQNDIERLGVARAVAEIARADILIILLCGGDQDAGVIRTVKAALGDNFDARMDSGQCIFLHTKSDLPDREPLSAETLQFLQDIRAGVVEISAVSRSGLDVFLARLSNKASELTRLDPGATLITSQRHIAQLRLARASIGRGLEALRQNLPAECIAQDLREGADALAAITGAFASDDIVNEIFAHFCIGK